VKWPASTEKTSWKRFEDELDLMMEHVLVGKLDNKLHVMSKIIYNFGKERFGIIEGKKKKPVKENRRIQKIAKIRGDLRRLTATFKKAPKEEKEALKVLRGILSIAKDWQMEVDLKKKLKFPEEITVSKLRPDIVLWSSASKQVVLLELTVLWEERIEESYERKLEKYKPLVDTCKERGWRSWCFPVEVGCSGFPARSLWRAFGCLGVTGQARNKASLIVDLAQERRAMDGGSKDQ
jgi:hypothetical protein